MANVKELLENKCLYTNAKEFSEQIKLEDGIKNAIELIEAKNG
jgi:UDP:flavonoid glycosyltransferase YjiC (YdhE family)